MRWEPGQGCDATPEEGYELGQFSEKGSQYRWSHAGNGREQSGLFRKGTILGNQASDATVKVGNLTGKGCAHRVDERGHLILSGAMATWLLGLVQFHQLFASTQEIGEPGAGTADRDRHRQGKDGSHPGEHTGLVTIRLGQHAGGPRELASPSRIDPREGGGGKGCNQVAPTAAGRLEDEEDVPFRGVEERGTGLRVVGDTVELSGGEAEEINEGTRQIAADNGL
ncbi:hypothetical protein ACRC7T_18930 [Segnochrobactraceae bacterium EtOH-i3]